MTEMRVAFVLDSTGPSGGNRYIFEVCNHLVDYGHKVVVYARQGSHRWFNLNCRVKYFRDDLQDVIGSHDIMVATWWTTAFWVSDLETDAVLFYLIQNMDAWFDQSYRRHAETTYTLPLHLIVVSTWLRNYLRYRYGRHVEAVIPGGVDHSVFSPGSPVMERRLLTQYRPLSPRRDWGTTREVIEILRRERPDIEIWMFGRHRLLEQLDVRYFLAPPDHELSTIYRSSRVFLNTSLLEGCTLPPLEAMSCGCVPVSTRLGTADYLVNGVNGLWIRPMDPDDAVDKVLILMDDDDLYLSMRKSAIETSKGFTWERTSREIERVFLEWL